MMTCRSFLQALLKTSNFILLLFGTFILIYSFRMLKQSKSLASSQASSPSFSPNLTDFTSIASPRETTPATLYLRLQFLRSYSSSDDDSFPWFICSTVVIGLIITFVAILGAVSAELDSILLYTVYQYCLYGIIIMEAGIVGFILFDDTWDEDLFPPDSTGQLAKAKEFVEANSDFCKLVGTIIVLTELADLLLAMVIKAMSETVEVDEFSEEVREHNNQRARKSLLSSHTIPLLQKQQQQQQQQQTPFYQPFIAGSSESDPQRNDTQRINPWHQRMLERYGLDVDQFNHPPRQETHTFLPIAQCEIVPKRKRCIIM